MNRRQFIKLSTLCSIGVSMFPQLSFQHYHDEIPYEELIGKGNPKLYGDGFRLRKEVSDAFTELSRKALESDIHLQIVSSYRGFDHQNRIWERKYQRYTNMGLGPKDIINKIIEYSTIPGTSRHHWGTDLDIIDGNVTQPENVLNPRHYEGSGCFSKFKLWMDANANDFGFFLTYTNNKQRKGFKYEPWHFSYKPLSQKYLEQYQRLDLKAILASEGLMGSEHFTKSFVETYINENILDINPELL